MKTTNPAAAKDDNYFSFSFWKAEDSQKAAQWGWQ